MCNTIARTISIVDYVKKSSLFSPVVFVALLICFFRVLVSYRYFCGKQCL